MDDRFKPKKEQNSKPKESNSYKENVRKLVAPFIKVSDALEAWTMADTVAGLLDDDEETVLDIFHMGYLDATVGYLEMIKETREAMKKGKISKDAPWYETLEKKMLTLELFSASISYEITLKPEETKDPKYLILKKILKEIKEGISSKQDGGSDKK
ncbi:MAG: hypothetical protein V4699_01385 [Patescibacteria group bacterium]